MDTRTQVNKEWLTIKEVGDWLGVGRSTAYDLIYQGLPSYRISDRTLRVRKQDLEVWLENKKNLPVV